MAIINFYIKQICDYMTSEKNCFTKVINLLFLMYHFVFLYSNHLSFTSHICKRQIIHRVFSSQLLLDNIWGGFGIVMKCSQNDNYCIISYLENLNMSQQMVYIQFGLHNSFICLLRRRIQIRYSNMHFWNKVKLRDNKYNWHKNGMSLAFKNF